MKANKKHKIRNHEKEKQLVSRRNELKKKKKIDQIRFDKKIKSK